MTRLSGSPTRADFRRTVLDNGVRVVTERIDYVRSVSLGVWIRAGARDERQDLSGISHFLEHMVFKGTEGRSALEIAQALESVGGGLDAFTSREHTCFLARVLREHVPLAVEVVADLVQRPALAAGDIELEKQVVVEEIHSLEDAPEELVHEEFARNIWHDHALKNRILGTLETVNSLTPEAVREHRLGHYSCDRLVVAAAGDLDHDRIVELVATHFGSLRRNGVPAEPVAADAFRPVIMHVRDLLQEHLCIGWRSVSVNHPDRYAALLAASLLGGGMSSRLYQAVRERAGLAYSISTYADFLGDSGIFGTYVAVKPENTGSAARLILDEIRRLKAQGIRDPELDSVKAQVVGGLVISMEGMTPRMGRIARCEIHGQPFEEIDSVIEAVQAVSAADVARVLEDPSSPGRVSMVGLGPVDEDAVSEVLLSY